MAAVTSVVAHPGELRARWRSATLAAVIAAAGGVAITLSMAAPAFHGLPLHVLDQTIDNGVAAVYIAAGVVAILRRPVSPTGPLLAVVGFLWMVHDLYWLYAPLPYTIALAYESLWQAALATLALVFPAGRFDNRVHRTAAVLLWAWTLITNPVRLLFFDPTANGCPGCRQLLLVHADQTIYTTVDRATSYVGMANILIFAVLIAAHWRGASRAGRRVMEPLAWAVPPAVIYLVARQLVSLNAVPPNLIHVVSDYLPAGVAVLPIGFLIGLLRTRLDYAAVGARLPELASRLVPGRVRAVLAETLHDPDLELLYWSPAAESYVDVDGRVRDPVAGPGRAVVPIAGESGPLAVMIIDRVTLDEPGLLQAAAALARLALENERLQAEVRSQLVQLRSTTARIVEAGHDARRRLERDLHDGAQQRLLALSLTLGRARTLAGGGDPELDAFLEQAAEDLQQAITELRELARGIHPMLLTQEGLGSALRALADRAPLPVLVSASDERFPRTVEETAYFLVCEAITNAARHSGAGAVWIELSCERGELTVRVRDDGSGGLDAGVGEGSGLTGMKDRVIAVGGRLTVSSPRGGGTTITARLPCG